MPRCFAPLVLALLAGACALRAPDDGSDHHEDGTEPLGTVQSALEDSDPVAAAVDASCTTSAVKGLATQLIDEIQCLRPGTLASIEADPGFSLASAVFPWLQAPARLALLEVQKQRGVTMTINSALRTLPQQYLLYRWYKAGRCGIGLAAAPGKSNHESALAVDIDDNASWREAMAAHEFVWLGSSDPVHFDYKGEGQVDIRGLSVQAFQRLWNRNHPEDRIEEDSAYGPATEERLSKSPVGGFAKGADCAAPSTNPPPPPPPPPTASNDGGAGLPLGASGTREDAEQGCAMSGKRATSATSATSTVWLAAVALGLAALGRRRLRRADQR
jgi:hypothetical protein